MTVKAPRIVLFRHAPVDFDSRIKRVARTLQRGGFEPIIISVEPADGESGEFLLGGDIRVIRVPLKVAPAAPKSAAQVAADADKLRRQRKVYAQRVSGLDARSAKSVIKWGLTSGRLASIRGKRLAKALLRRANSAKVAPPTRCVGSAAINSVQAAVPAMATAVVRVRPARSAIRPKTVAPTGRPSTSRSRAWSWPLQEPSNRGPWRGMAAFLRLIGASSLRCPHPRQAPGQPRECSAPVQPGAGQPSPGRPGVA